MRTLRIGVIGVGGIASMHLQSYVANPRVELLAVYDLNVERATEIASQYGAPRVYPTLSEFLSDPDIDAVSICTWNDSHAEIAIAALSAGKHVLVEKPMTKTVAEAEAVAAAVARTGKQLQVGFVRRFSSNARVLKSFIDAGELGDIYYARATYITRIGNPGGWFADSARSGGGPLIDLGIHVLDLCWYMMGCPQATTVSGITYERLGNRANVTSLARYTVADYDPTTSNVEDVAVAFIRFENGSSLTLEASYSLHASRDEIAVSLYGEKGGADLEPELRIVNERHDTILNINPQVNHLSFDYDDGFEKEINHFVLLCLGEVEPIATVEHGVEMMRILSAVYESAARGHEIVIDRDET